MNNLAQGVAFLASLNLAHGNLRPENIPLDRNRLRISDFDCTAEFGTDFETCPCPYGRLLNSNEADQGIAGTTGFLGSRTEQFALGSLYYLINYGFEVYGNQCLGDDPYEHGPKVMDLLQDMKFPKLDRDPLIDDIIDKCWHNQYRTLTELTTHTVALLKEPISKAPNHEATSSLEGQLWTNCEVINSDGNYSVDQDHSFEPFSSKKDFCQDLEKRGLLRLLISGKPMELGFNMEHRHVLSNTLTN
ncbi:serine/threonine protein kinase [Penicillium psychrosexuale]|uniref:serine/threonine protein kinase n=1 Tax=Penicillium psychrosexuale TaxID=1002107 RepID=UPI002544EEE9|nr:serine/threonine protein kinase [Penicillium psychrosexuale]KAJ5796857.1 serine/threonine protein kinase [Penicillium psychrosexuale]